MYEVVIEGKVRGHIERLQGDVLKRIDRALKRIEANPRHSGAEKLAGFELWRVRVGDYRIIYEISDEAKKAIVYRIKHRKEAYKRF